MTYGMILKLLLCYSIRSIWLRCRLVRIHLLIITEDFVALSPIYVVFIITSFLAGVESGNQCLLNSEVLSCFSGVILSIRSSLLFSELFR